VLRVDPATCGEADLATAVEWLQAGKLVAFPTDTLYGLAADPTSESAVRNLFTLKGREPSAAIPLIASSIEQVEAWCSMSQLSRRLAGLYWPGPLSLILDAPASVVPAVHAGRRTVAIRVPDHAVARILASAFGRPITATSANRSGENGVSVPALLPWEEDDRVLVVDGGATAGGAPSTIVDARDREPVLVREGAIAWNRVLHSLER
jgi:L-threonylcarbamoyladenylate synthase